MRRRSSCRRRTKSTVDLIWFSSSGSSVNFECRSMTYSAVAFCLISQKLLMSSKSASPMSPYDAHCASKRLQLNTIKTEILWFGSATNLGEQVTSTDTCLLEFWEIALGKICECEKNIQINEEIFRTDTVTQPSELCTLAECTTKQRFRLHRH